MKDIADHLIANPSLIRMRTDYNAGIEEVKARALDLLAESLIAELPSDYPGALRANMTNDRFGTDDWGSIRITSKVGSFKSTPYQIVIEHVSKWGALVIGVESKWNTGELSEQEAATLEQLNLLLNKEALENNVHKADPQQTWYGEFWPVGWHNLAHPWHPTDEVILELLDAERRNNFVKDLVSRAMIYIRLIERLHQEASNDTTLPEQ
jgi:hypothetical protein